MGKPFINEETAKWIFFMLIIILISRPQKDGITNEAVRTTYKYIAGGISA
ncbi:MAG: hypothetical protein LBC53_01475 [Spirochaetaceae bacterium]|jgi:hypothetical protein|nr:hypothetical protein [Spirochaetaceae bacterium]